MSQQNVKNVTLSIRKILMKHLGKFEDSFLKHYLNFEIIYVRELILVQLYRHSHNHSSHR